jgi:hypothetical protein
MFLRRHYRLNEMGAPRDGTARLPNGVFSDCSRQEILLFMFETPRPSTATATAAEPHPEIREAIAALRRAKEHMEHAAHDFGGHRVEAIRATDVAIHQLEDCLKYDRD